MTPKQLRAHLDDLGISQVELSRLLHVTPRAVSLWMSGERSVPGPAQAYLHLLTSLPPAQREAEFARLGAKWGTLEDGIYSVRYKNADGGRGEATLIFEGGRIFGTDLGRSRYDGTYRLNHESGRVELTLRIEIQPGERSVAGQAQKFAWVLDATTSVPAGARTATLAIASSLADDLTAEFAFVRPLPER